MDFPSRLLSWYKENKRDLPWRRSNDPYTIWVSEIILQQTRMEQGLVFFHRFINAFPDLFALAAAPEEEVLRTWQGFGYYSRARNMHAAARDIVDKHAGVLPRSHQAWEKLKGVGPYTAAAISSMAFGEIVPAVDGNVYRILSRIFAIDESIDTAKGKEIIREIADSLIDQYDPGGFNQAMMDFGSQVCKPAQPDCLHCLFNRECRAFQRKSIANYPVRNPKRKPISRYFNYFYFFNETAFDGLFFVRQRLANDIWKNLFELPMLETPQPISMEEIVTTDWWRDLFGGDQRFLVTRSPLDMIHQLTHQRIYARFFTVNIHPDLRLSLLKEYLEVTNDMYEKMAKPMLMDRYMKR
jgi:A/G-specific adenine glycosylase